MSLVADEELGLFAGLNVNPKKSYLAEYSSRIDHQRVIRLPATWHELLSGTDPLAGASFDLDFHSVPCHGEDPVVERHYVSARSRRQPGILVFLAQDGASRALCYSNADLRKGEEEEIFRFIAFWKEAYRGILPKHLVFDSGRITYAGLGRLDAMGIPLITLRRRSPSILKEIVTLPRSAWRTVELDIPARKCRLERYRQVQQQRHVLDVIEIVLQLFHRVLDGISVLEMDLGPSKYTPARNRAPGLPPQDFLQPEPVPPPGCGLLRGSCDRVDARRSLPCRIHSMLLSRCRHTYELICMYNQQQQPERLRHRREPAPGERPGIWSHPGPIPLAQQRPQCLVHHGRLLR